MLTGTPPFTGRTPRQVLAAHLTEAHEPDEVRPLWMAYKRREFYIDDEFAAHCDRIIELEDGRVV